MAEYISFQPSDHYSTKLFTGNASADNAITGVGFQPDLTWFKYRGGDNWACSDAVRGSTEALHQNLTLAEYTNANGCASFDADGFTVGTDSTWNSSGASGMATWNWKAGTTTGLSGGTITPSAYSINTTSGIGIYKYEGTGSAATIAHGLGVAPKMIIVKDLDNADGWMTYHEGLGSGSPGGAYLVLNTAAAESTGNTSKWNGTAPTDTVFSLGSAGDTNQSSTDFIAYVFADVKGYSKFGSYTGNGNADGTFVYTGFRPAFVLVKTASRAGTDAWCLFDNKREGYNVDNDALNPDTTAAERTSDDIDLLSNGFKLRNTVTDVNPSGETVIYAAFAEFPIVSSNDVPTVAR